MPPKKVQTFAATPNKKTEQKKKEKIVEDKTFGLKNRKGSKQQKFVQQVTQQVKYGNISASKVSSQKQETKKKQESDELRDLNKLMKPVAEMPKVAKDVDPKSVLCLFFKQGMCQKGGKCKFSHDLASERKTAKRNLYVDSRDIEENMDDWDENKLSEVAETKHGDDDRKRANQTDIVCKYFLDAVENSKYGWFWECPNGNKCIYRHALPHGFILKKDKKKLEEMKKMDEISLEELIEKERAALSSKNLTKVTFESFVEWKKGKLRIKRLKEKEEDSRKIDNFRLGKQVGLSGRDLFTYNPNFACEDDEEAEDAQQDIAQQQQDDIEAVDIDERMFDIDFGEIDLTNEELVASAITDINEELFDVDYDSSNSADDG